MSTEHWWNDTNINGGPKCQQKNLSQCHSAHLKFHKDWPVFKPRHLLQQAKNYQLNHGTTQFAITITKTLIQQYIHKLVVLRIWAVELYRNTFGSLPAEGARTA